MEDNAMSGIALEMSVAAFVGESFKSIHRSPRSLGTCRLQLDVKMKQSGMCLLQEHRFVMFCNC